MKLQFRKDTLKWNHPIVDKLARHEVVFRAPVCDPTYGLPIGDGDMGSLIWVSEDTLHFNVNKTDLFDNSTRSDNYCSKTEEDLTTCRNGVHLKWQFNCPIFESMYQLRYESRLDIACAMATIDARTAFGHAQISAFASRAYGVTVMDMDVDFCGDDAPMNVIAERWGSRTFWRWYSKYKNMPERGLDGTGSGCLPEDSCLYITQHLNGTDFCAALKIVSDAAPLDCRRINAHTAQCVTAPAARQHMTCYLTIVTGQSMDEVKAEAIDRVLRAAEAGRAQILERHLADWREFWDKSFVSLPDTQTYDYIENMWYLSMYYANSEMKGKAPQHFCNGIWGFSHDFVPWNYYFHYNMQIATFPLEAANHPELLETYYDFRVNQLPHAQQFAREYLNMPGAFYADVSDRFGRNDWQVYSNCTCGPQIAMELYTHYLYSGDREYFEKKALPVMLATAEFYLAKFQKGDDGLYHINGTTAYEGVIRYFDSLTDHVMVRTLFTALVKELDTEKAAPYAEVLSHLPPFKAVDMYDDEVRDGVFIRGIGKGKQTRGDKVLSIGRRMKKEQWDRKVFGNPDHGYYGFPDIEMAPVFPSGMVGIKDRGTALYDMIYNSCCLHPNGIQPYDSDDPEDCTCMQWCLQPIYLARMGMHDLLYTSLERTIKAWMVYPQGFGREGGYGNDPAAASNRWFNYNPRNVETDIRDAQTPAWPFRHFDYETLPIIAAAVNEMLLQSHDGIIRLFCAWNPDEDVCFRLTAMGGHQVHAVYRKGGEMSAVVECVRDAELKLAFEHVTKPVAFTDAATGAPIAAVYANGVYTISAVAGQAICAATDGMDDMALEVNAERNMDVKRLGSMKLGCPTEYGLK